MKKIPLLLMVCMVHFSFGQKSFPEPDFSNTPMWYDEGSGMLKNFERLQANVGTRLTGMMSAESLIFFPGENATVQFTQGKLPAFLVKMNTPNEDPSASIEIAKLQVNKRKHQREFISGKAGMGGTKTTMNTLMIDFKKVNANGVYQIIPSNELTVGEYAFSNAAHKAFLFSVVEVESTATPTQKAVKEEPHPHDPLGEFIYDKIQEGKAKKTEGNANQPQQITRPSEAPTPAKISHPTEVIKEEPKAIPQSEPVHTSPPAQQVKVGYYRTEVIRTEPEKPKVVETPAPPVQRAEEVKPTPLAPPPAKTITNNGVDELLKWKKLLDAGVITQAEFDAKKKQLLGN